MVFVIKVKNYKVSSKFVKSAREKVYSIGFPSSEVLNGNLSFKSISEKIGAKSFEEWNAMQEFISGKPTWCYFDFDEKNGEKNGKLYNWFAVSDTRGLAPNGYHIPSDAEWTILTDKLGGEEIAGEKMKSKTGWKKNGKKSGNGNNSSGFNGLPGGACNKSGSFSGVADYGGWWSSSESKASSAWIRYLGNDDTKGYRGSSLKNNGFSVRCLRD